MKALSSDFAPVAIFAFNRPDHLNRLLESLKNNNSCHKMKFWIFIDGPRNGSDDKPIESVISIATKFSLDYDVEIIRNESNVGLSASLIRGITKVLTIHSKIIVLEDDLFLSKHFLNFCNQGLVLYENNSKVASIHGFSYPISDEHDTPYFLRGADCWGWATWRDRWQLFECDSEKLYKELQRRNLSQDFDLSGAARSMQMLKRQADGILDSWAIRWHASMFLADRLTLYPNISLVRNEGRDGTGTHGGGGEFSDVQLSLTSISPYVEKVEESSIMRKRLEKYLRKTTGTYRKYTPSWFFNGVKRRIFTS